MISTDYLGTPTDPVGLELAARGLRALFALSAVLIGRLSVERTTVTRTIRTCYGASRIRRRLISSAGRTALDRTAVAEVFKTGVHGSPGL
jgi:hypothetical protein